MVGLRPFGGRSLTHIGEYYMAKRAAKRRFNAVQESSNIIEMQPYMPQKKLSVAIHPRNKHQRTYLQKLQNDVKNIVFAIGPAGTGKTLLACQTGVQWLKGGKVEKIIVTRPAVSVDEDLGFLPGSLQQKMEPWTRPIFDVLHDYYYSREIEHMVREGIIEISPLAYMRGRTFKNAWIIADEMQNATPNQMKMLLTRLGEGSKMVVTGDLRQADRLDNNGLLEFVNLLDEVENLTHVDVIRFDNQDIERHNAVKEILEIYGD